MKTAECPSCGAPVVFRAATSIVVVCDYCRSTLVRGDVAPENLGRMAELMDDHSPIRRGAEGSYRGMHFAVVGRLQYRHAAGIWNEWHLLFDDARSGWLSESAGNYVVTFPAVLREPIPVFEAIAVGDGLMLARQGFQVVNKETAAVIAGEGELPFRVGPGYEAPVVDLANERNFATLDFSDDPPRAYMGSPVTLAGLKMTGLATQRAAARVRARAFACLACGAPIALHAEGSLVAACTSCGAMIDVAGERFALITRHRANEARFAPRLPLGTVGRLRGVAREVVGFLRRQIQVDGVAYSWGEYLLWSAQEGFCWLTEYNGHWNLVTTLNGVPRPQGAEAVSHLGRSYRHFQTAWAEVIYVAGEFYWRVEEGERAEVTDYVSPPYLLSKERSGSEITWSLAEYLTPDEVRAAFRLAAPLMRPVGVYANQPSPHAGSLPRYLAAFAAFAVLAVAIQIGFVVTAQNKEVWRETVSLGGAAHQLERVTGSFEIGGRDTNLVLRNATNVANNWLYLDMTLVDEAAGRSWHADREVSYYSGHDSDGAWSEGDPKDEVVFAGVPAGRYHLELAAETQPGARAPVTSQLSVLRDVPGWLNLGLLLGALALGPVFAYMRSAGFESRRWAESDHAAALVSDGGDDDD